MTVERITPQLVKKGKGKKRPGYRGDRGYQGSSGGSKASSGGSKGTSNTGGAGNQNTGNARDDYRANYSSRSIVKGGGTKKAGGGYNDAKVSGDRGRSSAREFVQQLNNNNAVRAAQTGQKFTPYKGGSRPQGGSLGGLGNLLMSGIGMLMGIPGLGLLTGGFNKLKGGLGSLNDKIQSTDFARSKTLMDYLDAKKYGGIDARNRAASKNMREARGIQTAMDMRPTTLDPREMARMGLQMPTAPRSKPTFSDPFANTVGTTANTTNDAVSSYVPFSNYGKANAATLDGVPLNEALAPTPVEQLRDKAYTGIKENVGLPFSSFLNNLMNADQIAALENEYGSKYGITNTSGGISSDARHMAAMNELSNSLSPMNNKFGNFIGDTGAFLAGAINEIPALFRGLNSKNLGEIKEDIIANYKGSFGTPNQTTAEQIYGDVFEGSTPARTASVPTYGTAAAAEVRPAIGMENTGLGFSIPTGDVGLNASGRLGNLSATVDAMDVLKGESVNPQINYSGDFGNTTAYGNFSDDVQNLGLNFNNDKGLSGGISYDAITGEPRFDIGFRRTFADGGLASMFTRRG